MGQSRLMRIIKISGLFDTVRIDASPIVLEYIKKRNKIPTVGEVVSSLLENPNIDTQSIDHEHLKQIAQEAISYWRNKGIV